MKKLLFFTLSLLLSLSMNAQLTWNEVFSGFTDDSRGISFIHIGDAQNAWGIGYDGTSAHATVTAVTKTTDGGQTWTVIDPVTLTGTINPGLSMVFSAGGDVAYMAAYKTGSFGSNGVWKTTDGGQNWTKVTGSSVYDSSTSFTNIVYFFDAQNGLTTGDPGSDGEFEIYVTHNAGSTWSKVPGSSIPNPLASDEYGYVHSYAAAGNSFWFTTAYGRIFKTTDMGNNWVAYQTPVADFGGGRVSTASGNITFKDNNEGWITDQNDVLYHTTDTGNTWNQMTPTGTVYGADIKFVPGSGNMLISTGSAQNSSGSSFSTDGGLNWTNIDSNVQHTALAVFNARVGYSGGFSDQANNKGIFVLNNASAISTSSIEGLNVYPNPAHNVISISVEENDIESITIFDLTGKQIYLINNVDTNITSIDTTNFDNGVYLIKIIDKDNNQQTMKLIIK